MPSPDLMPEAQRQFTICNACRYCEGYCAVFPAMERHRLFTPGDVEYIASLCHDCRDCYYACQYAPPHEFAVNIPLLLSEVRSDTHVRHATPRGNAQRLGGAGALLLIGAVAFGLGAALILLLGGPGRLFTPHVGPGAFFAVLPESVLDILFTALGVLWLAAWTVSGLRFWRATATDPGQRLTPGALWQALADALRLHYLGGGGAGCAYPAEAPSALRRVLHHMVFYGFLLDLLSTALAAVYDHLLGIPAPYPVLSPVVLLGCLGGAGIVLGAFGLLVLKTRADREPASPRLQVLDRAFLLALLLVAVTGFLLLTLRSTALMGSLLVLHLATVAALFVTAPYGKFAHLVYRFAALVRHALESSADRAGKAR